jgi:flagellar hook-length control protein FliK
MEPSLDGLIPADPFSDIAGPVSKLAQEPDAFRPTETARAPLIEESGQTDDHKKEGGVGPAEVSLLPGREVGSGGPSSPAEQVAHAIREHAGPAAREGRTEVSLRLDPPELGAIRIHLSATEHTLSARLVVEQEATRQLLENQVQALRDRLAEAGVTLGSFDISRHQTGAHSQGRQPHPEPKYVPPLVPGRISRAAERGGGLSSRSGEVDLVA